MEGTIFLQYYNYNDDNFDVGEYFKDSQSYIDALNKFATSDSNFMQVNKNDDNIQYAQCHCKIYDEDNNLLDIDKFVSYYNSNEMVMLVLELELDSADEEFHVELKDWVESHERLDKIPNLDEDKRFLVEPKRDLKFIFNNKSNKETYALLSNSMLIDRIDLQHYVIIVDKVIFTQTF